MKHFFCCSTFVKSNFAQGTIWSICQPRTILLFQFISGWNCFSRCLFNSGILQPNNSIVPFLLETFCCLNAILILADILSLMAIWGFIFLCYALDCTFLFVTYSLLSLYHFLSVAFFLSRLLSRHFLSDKLFLSWPIPKLLYFFTAAFSHFLQVERNVRILFLTLLYLKLLISFFNLSPHVVQSLYKLFFFLGFSRAYFSLLLLFISSYSFDNMLFYF